MNKLNNLRRSPLIRYVYQRFEGIIDLSKGQYQTGISLRRGFIRHIRPDCIFDVGANIGQFVVDSQSVVKHIPIFSFEPVHEPFLELQKLTSRSKTCHAIELGIGNSGVRVMNVANNNSLSSSVFTPEIHLDFAENVSFDKRAKVDFISLKQALKDYAIGFSNILLKIDVQGAEIEVLKDLKEVRHKVAGIIVEASFTKLYSSGSTFYSVIDILRLSGFEIVYIDNQGKNKSSFGAHYCDIYAIRNSI